MYEKIGFVGVGRMGANMARRLADMSWKVTALFDAVPESANRLAEELRARACLKLSEVTQHSDVVFTVVSDDAAMEAIYFQPNDNLLNNARGKLFINCATISPELHVRIEKVAAEAGASSLEACMASSISQARDGSLYLMCGGAANVFARAEPILRQLS
ncbi:MAG: NAD(P)-binding domain-containing protein, partial [Verrucomicrobiota bacterium]|nr:NAD(P)-binding domain-containing protein [Verrucomicrobiota bacterium]